LVLIFEKSGDIGRGKYTADIESYIFEKIMEK
jgi:hypothetical protein